VQGLRLSAEQQVLFTVELSNRLSAMVSEPTRHQAGRVESLTKEQASVVVLADNDCGVSAKAMAAVSSARGRSAYHRTLASS
jgi:C4-dicarboxylate-specific signal transduction histidine kinase